MAVASGQQVLIGGIICAMGAGCGRVDYAPRADAAAVTPSTDGDDRADDTGADDTGAAPGDGSDAGGSTDNGGDSSADNGGNSGAATVGSDARAPLAGPTDAGPNVDSPSPASSTALVHLQFDESSGALAVDSSGNGNSAELQGYGADADWQSGQLGNALDLDGANHWGQIPYSENLSTFNGGQTISVAVWIRPVAVDDWAGLISRQRGTSRTHLFVLQLNSGGFPQFDLNTHAKGNVTTACSAPNQARANVWSHIAGTWDGSVARLYVDGTEACSFTHTEQFPTETTSLHVGGVSQDPTPEPGFRYSGRLDELLVYDRALTPAEVSGLAARQPPP